MSDSIQNLGTNEKKLPVLLRGRLRAAFNQLKNIRRESRLKIAVVTLLGLVFWLGLFGMFMHAFDFLYTTASVFRPLLVRHILSLFFLALFFMLVFSNTVISFASLFRARETAFLFSLPVRHDTIFLYKLFESLLFSSWAVFAAGLPLLLAYGIKSQVEWYFYPLALVFMLPFVLLPAAIGSLLSLVLTAIMPRQGGKLMLGLALAALILSLGLGARLLHVEHAARANYGLELEASVSAVLPQLSFTQHYLTPNYWMTEGLLSFSEGRSGGFRDCAYFFLALSSSAFFFLALGWFLAGSFYRSIYSTASASTSTPRSAGRAFLETAAGPLLRRFPEIMLLLIKDVKTFLRDPTQWSQVAIFFGILILYIGNLRNFSYPIDQPFYYNLISFLNLGATCLTLATLTTRFIFPLISLEGRRFWILGLLPLKRRDIVLAKFYFALFGSLLITTSLLLLSNYVLRNSWFVIGIQLITGVLVSLGLSGLSVGMGALFPSFQESNPSRIVSGFGGTLTLILAMGLVIFTITGEGLVCHRLLLTKLVHTSNLPDALDLPMDSHIYLVVGCMAILNILAACIPLHLGIRALERVEF
jgi:ABC-2 type transport system permease protein